MVSLFIMAKKKHRKDTILEKALEIYLWKGPEELTMRHIAKHTGITVSGLYKHYKNKAELLFAMLAEGFRLFADYLQVAENEAVPREKLRKLGEQYRKFAFEHEMYYRLIMMNIPQSGLKRAQAPEGFLETTTRSFLILLRIVNENMEKGILKKGDPEKTAQIIWGTVHGMVSLYLNGMLTENQQGFNELYRQSLNKIYDGLMN